MRGLQGKSNQEAGTKKLSSGSSRERGIALLVVLIFMVVLGVMAAAFAINMEVDFPIPVLDPEIKTIFSFNEFIL